MSRTVTFLLTFFVFGASALRADFSYTQTTRVTGGSILNMTRFIPGAGGLKDPRTHTIAVKGGKMVTYDKDAATIIDADAGTITQVDFKKKQFAVITFEEMKEALDAVRQQMEQAQAQLRQAQGQQLPPVNPLDSFKISVNETGQSKQIATFNTKQYILTMEITAPPTGTPAGLPGSKTTMDAWLTPKLPGYEEVTQFGMKLAARMPAFSPGTNPVGMYREDVAQSVSAMAAEMSKMNGIPVYETLTMTTMQPAGPSLGDAAKAGAKESTIGRLGGLAGLGRRREEPPKVSDQQSQEVTYQPVILMEQVTELSNLSATVDASKFAVPTGFKQVDHELKKLIKKK